PDAAFATNGNADTSSPRTIVTRIGPRTVRSSARLRRTQARPVVDAVSTAVRMAGTVGSRALFATCPSASEVPPEDRGLLHTDQALSIGGRRAQSVRFLCAGEQGAGRQDRRTPRISGLPALD